MSKARVRIALHCGLIFWGMVFGIAFSSCVAQETATPNPEAQAQAERSQDANLLSFNELVALASAVKPEGSLAARFNALLNTPFVHSDGAAEIQPHRPRVAGLGLVLRVGQWNIERGLNFDLIRSALANPGEFLSMTKKQDSIDPRRQKIVESELAALQAVDVLVLNEADWGMKRTEYRNVARELAAALHMNYAYGVEFVEVDPVFDLDTEQLHLPDPQQDQRLQQDLQVDPQRYHGLHGTAILSRYPIDRARILRLPVCYDWYANEYKAISKLEQGRRWSAHKLFRERVERELRQGGRMALIAEISVPDLPTGRATIVATHLENKCTPACRRRQMQALLADVKADKNPLIIAGDLNTTSRDNTPTSVRNEIMTRVTDYKFWIGQAVSYFHPLGVSNMHWFQFATYTGITIPRAFIFRFFGTIGNSLCSRRWRSSVLPTISHSISEESEIERFRQEDALWRTATSGPERASCLPTRSLATSAGWSAASSLTGSSSSRSSPIPGARNRVTASLRISLSPCVNSTSL